MEYKVGKIIMGGKNEKNNVVFINGISFYWL